jgi:hypothetical protein
VRNAQDRRPPRIVSKPNLRAAVGERSRYDEDGLPTVQGDRRISWEAGKYVSDRRINMPDGMDVDAATGELRWTPTMSQVGDQRVTLAAANDVGMTAQEPAPIRR